MTIPTLSPARLPVLTPDQWQPERASADVRRTLAVATELMQQVPQVPVGQELAFIERLEAAENDLQQAWGNLSNQNAVMNTPVWRDTYNSLLPDLSRYQTEQGQNQDLYHLYERLSQSPAFAALSPARQESVRLALRDFQLSGVALEGADRERYAALNEQLSALSSRFSDQLLDATQRWVRPLQPSELAGLPESAIALLNQVGRTKGVDGPVATLDAPVYTAILTHSTNRALREELYHAYVTRASALAPASPATPTEPSAVIDNGPLMADILSRRQEKAQLLGFENYAELSLASKMAPDVKTVEQFLTDLAVQAREPAERDLTVLKAEGKALGIDPLEPWDTAFLAERIKQRDYRLSQEELRPYFPAPTAIAGLFAIAETLYGIQIRQKEAPVWHPDVTYYEIEEQGKPIGGFYLDPYARAGKRGGAWMSGYRSRMTLPDGQQQPIAFLTGNFSPPVDGKPALLTHDELVTLFHEFGHGLHHLLTAVDVLPVSGIHGVAWDAVELPSQFMEFWTWEPEALAMLSQHIDSGKPLPPELLDALLNARHFQSGLQALRQIEFALFDLGVHAAADDLSEAQIQHVLDRVRDQVSVMLPPDYNKFQNGFSHIFAGGYAAGYYSYKWAEVLASDAFDRFETEGVLNADTGRAFRQQVLAQGGSKPADEVFRDFRGRDAQLDALLRHSGWIDRPVKPVSA